MKSMLSLLGVCAVLALAGCQSAKTSAVAPGAVGESKNGCCASKEACTASKSGTSMGAVGEKTECQKVCPMSGKTSTETVSPGAVGETKTGGCCSKAKKDGC
ncbi:MAG: hypothetical protein L0219_10885 [Phycisphaerales bacterium]|nr:hypothetical protein [Phycisphaerales bacterium]